MNDILSVIEINVHEMYSFFCSEAISCLRPQLFDEHLSITPLKITYAYKEVISFSCSAGYNLVGPLSKTCRNSGNFRDGLPDCQGKIVTYLWYY